MGDGRTRLEGATTTDASRSSGEKETVLIERVGNGEVDESMGALYDLYSSRLYGLGIRLLGDRGLAEELVQETFLRLWRSAPRFDRELGSGTTFVFTIARRVAIDLRRRRSSRPHAALADERDRDDGPSGELELQATLVSAAGDASAFADVVKLGIGREIDFRSDDLPILPKGEFYELWFAAPEDSPSEPNRISAGTFHPDENGRSRVTLTAAVDPALYPTLVVSAEPGDGDPAPSGEDVLRSAPAE